MNQSGECVEYTPRLRASERPAQVRGEAPGIAARRAPLVRGAEVIERRRPHVEARADLDLSDEEPLHADRDREGQRRGITVSADIRGVAEAGRDEGHERRLLGQEEVIAEGRVDPYVDQRSRPAGALVEAAEVVSLDRDPPRQAEDRTEIPRRAEASRAADVAEDAGAELE